MWVLRELAGVPLAGCDADPDDFSGFVEHPCWRQPYALDGFGADGRYLGRIRVPDGTRVDLPPSIAGDTMVTVVEDPAGTIMVKRYRLVRPGEARSAAHPQWGLRLVHPGAASASRGMIESM